MFIPELFLLVELNTILPRNITQVISKESEFHVVTHTFTEVHVYNPIDMMIINYKSSGSIHY